MKLVDILTKSGKDVYSKKILFQVASSVKEQVFKLLEAPITSSSFLSEAAARGSLSVGVSPMSSVAARLPIIIGGILSRSEPTDSFDKEIADAVKEWMQKSGLPNDKLYGELVGVARRLSDLAWLQLRELAAKGMEKKAYELAQQLKIVSEPQGWAKEFDDILAHQDDVGYSMQDKMWFADSVFEDKLNNFLRERPGVSREEATYTILGDFFKKARSPAEILALCGLSPAKYEEIEKAWIEYNKNNPYVYDFIDEMGAHDKEREVVAAKKKFDDINNVLRFKSDIRRPYDYEKILGPDGAQNKDLRDALDRVLDRLNGTIPLNYDEQVEDLRRLSRYIKMDWVYLLWRDTVGQMEPYGKFPRP